MGGKEPEKAVNLPAMAEGEVQKLIHLCHHLGLLPCRSVATHWARCLNHIPAAHTHRREAAGPRCPPLGEHSPVLSG